MADTQTALELSDEDFLKQDPTEFFKEIDEAAVEAADPEISSDEQPSEDEIAASDEATSEAQEQTATEEEEMEVSQPEGDTPQEPKPTSEASEEESLDTSDQTTDTDGDTQETDDFDYKSAYEKVTAPFKANGSEISIKDPDEVIRLMQMGLNYNKKMSQLKPHLKIVNMLENNGLLDESKLHELVDISKKDPKALAKLVKESGLDPLDIDTTASDDYKPTNYSVSDKEYNLDQVLDSIKDSPTFTRTIDTLTKDWDQNSRTTISDNPEIISIIDLHMGNGVFDAVNAEMQTQKALGKLTGVSDVEAYRLTIEDMQRTGKLVNPDQNTSEQTNQTKPVSSETKQQATEERNKKRKAVAPVKQTAPSKDKAEDNFLGLSDEEFMKKFA